MADYDYGQLIDDFELGVDVMPDEDLTAYIERRRREFESKADGGSIGIEVLFTDKMKNGGRVPAVSGGFLKLLAEGAAKGKKGIMELVESGKGRFDEFVETMNQSKKPSELIDSVDIPQYLIKSDEPMTLAKMNLDRKTIDTIENTYKLGLYDEMPEVIKAKNLLERFTKPVGSSGFGTSDRVIDYKRAEDILNVKLNGDETIDDLFEIEFRTRPDKIPDQGLADGGRVGLFMGGDPLTGQALNIYNSMNSYGFSDQEIANALSAQGLYTAGGTTDTPDTTIQPIGFQSNNEGGGGITELTPLNTKKNISSGINRDDKTFIDPLNENIASQMINQNPNLNKYTTEEIISMNPDMFNIKTDKGFIGNTIDNFKTMGGNLIDKFSGSKVGQGATKFKNMAFTPMMALMNMRNPLNPDAMNYNPNLQGQMDFLEGQTGTKITGTSDNLKFTDALMIGQDPNSGLTKYGPGSVLSGQNVVSGFGSNDYEKALNKYITRMKTYTNPTELQLEKIKQAQKELEAAKAKQAIADMKAEQSTIDKAKSNYADVYKSAQEQGFTGPGGGFSTSGAAPGTSLGSGQFSSKSSKGRKDYSEGGLATMFTRRR